MKKLLAAITVALAVGSCWAGTDQLLVNTGGVSFHQCRTCNYTEVNPGLGVIFEASKDHAVAVGGFRNSQDHLSMYAAWRYTPAHFDSVNIRFGLTTMAVNGYRDKEWSASAPDRKFDRGDVLLRLLPTVVHDSVLLGSKVQWNVAGWPPIGKDHNGKPLGVLMVTASWRFK